MSVDTTRAVISVCPPAELTSYQDDWNQLLSRQTNQATGKDPRWVAALCEGLGHTAHVLLASNGVEQVGVLPLIFVKSSLFGRFLVSLPYVNSSGIVARDTSIADGLVDAAIRLADDLDVKYLELRHETGTAHSGLGVSMSSKVHMRLALPATDKELMNQFKSKLRSQIRNGEKKGLTTSWGGEELLTDFYSVFCRNMRDLGTPVFGRRLFRSVLKHFGSDAELCVVRTEGRAIAAGLVVHSHGITEVPSASALREFNNTNANMVLYWNLLQRAIERGQEVFDFGRCEKEGPHFKFKEQWGAQPHPATWQYYVRRGNPADMRPQNAKFRLLIRIWQQLPVQIANAIGPAIVRGIP